MTLLELAEMIEARRAYYLSIGWDKADCAIGMFDGMLKLASDYGAVTYRMRDDGVIIRDAIGVRSKLIEFIETDLSVTISIHNRVILDGWRKTVLNRSDDGFYSVRKVVRCNGDRCESNEISHRSDEYVDVLTNPKSWTVRKVPQTI